MCDVCLFEDVCSFVSYVIEMYGSLDIWVNNVGIGYIMKLLLDVIEDDWCVVIDVNLIGVFFGVKVVVE